MELERKIFSTIEQAVADLHRSDLYRTPLVAFSDAADARYEKLHVENAGLHGADTCGKCIGACPLAYLE